MISLHQKIDMLLSNNGEQNMAIDELKKENATLKHPRRVKFFSTGHDEEAPNL